jgi:hypothetical protein
LAYQDVKGAIVVPVVYDAQNPGISIEQLRVGHISLAQEVRECHKRIQEFNISIGTGLTTIAVVFPIPTFTVNYYAGTDMSFDNGGVWSSAKAKTGFTLTWKTATVGTQSARILIVE